MTPRGVACAGALLLALTPTGCLVLAQSQGPAAPVFARTGTWTDENGREVSLDSFRGAPVVLSAFFTSCTVRCPLTIAKLQEVDAAFRQSGRTVPIVLLTLDPRNDTPERLRRFKTSHHLPDTWHFLRGSDQDTRAFARSLHVDPAYDDGHIDHEVRIAVFDASGNLTKGFAGWSFDAKTAVIQ